MKPTKTKTAKKTNHPMVGKLLDLKYRINEYKKTLDDVEDSNKDKLWVMGQISALREGARLDRHQMEYANEIWKEYK